MILELPNISLIMEDVPNLLFREIDRDINDIIAGTSTTEKITSALSAPGVPEHYRLTDNTERLMKDYVFAVADQYSKTSLYLNSVNLLRQPAPYHFNRPWVNVQRAGEFLPNHIHEGLLSYVIWVKIPDTIQNSEPTDVEGKFEFTYNNILGTTIGHNVSLDKSYIGKILMFPASLRHCVYPFKGDDVRVSVSGNILLG
jgi:hypothetical protein